jgi:hypothetical protein
VVLIICVVFVLCIVCMYCKKSRLDDKVFMYNSEKSIPKYICPNPNDVEELVVAMCNEDISWVDSCSADYKLVSIYNKCGKVVKFKSSNVNVFELPNIGSCDYAYLSYIIDRYDTLPDFVEFTKGWLKPVRKYNDCLTCVDNHNEFNSLMNFSIKNHNFANKLNNEYNKDKWYNSDYKDMKSWVKSMEFLSEDIYKRNSCNIIFGGQFGTTKKQILKTSKKEWEALRKQQKYSREEVDHFIERTWRPLLCRPSYNLVIVAIFKNESIAIGEWLEHYMREGVEHFYMIDNGSTDDWNTKVDGFPVTIYSDKVQRNQRDHYNHFLEQVKSNSEWVMLVDLDEFMNARKGYKTIPEYLDTLSKDIDQVQVRWKMFGSDNNIQQPNSITNGFTKRKKTEDDFISRHVKSICRTNYLNGFGVHTHNINERVMEPVPNSGCVTKNVIILPNILNESELNNSPLHLNHYCIQSLEWFKSIKMTRGDSDKNSVVRDIKYFNERDWGDIYDCELSDKFSDNWLIG